MLQHSVVIRATFFLFSRQNKKVLINFGEKININYCSLSSSAAALLFCSQLNYRNGTFSMSFWVTILDALFLYTSTDETFELVIWYGYKVWIINWNLFYPMREINIQTRNWFFLRNGKSFFCALSYCSAKSFLITIKICDISYPTFARTRCSGSGIILKNRI